MGSTRIASQKMYEACKDCVKNTSGFGVCKSGYENFYKRASKDNGCPIVQQQRTTCKRCQGRIVMSAFSEGTCTKCGAKIVSPNTPPPKLCIKCAIKLRRCSHCGILMN